MTYKLKSIFFFVFFLCSIALYYATEESKEQVVVQETEILSEPEHVDARI